MDVPVNEPGEDEPTGSIDNLGSVTRQSGASEPTSAIFAPRISILPFERGLPPVPSISVPFLMTRIPSGEELMVVSKDPFATYYLRLSTLSSDR